MITAGFSLSYNGKSYLFDKDCMVADVLRIQCQKKDFDGFDAVEWSLKIENTGTENSGLITDLFDCDVVLPLTKDPDAFPGDCLGDNSASIITMNGAVEGERYHDDDALSASEFRLHKDYILPGKQRWYSNGEAGRSSDTLAPFFDVNHGQEGYLVAIGWSGGWRAGFLRGENDIRIQTGLRNLMLRLHPGESIRTSSIMILRYQNGQTEARNRLRRLIKSLTPIARGERPAFAPLAFESWGGMPSDLIKEHLEALKAHKVRFDYHWMDAGWQGSSEIPSTNCFTGDWYLHTGEFFINKNYHPEELQDVVSCGEEGGMRLMFWVEPERSLANSPVFAEHPEYYLEWPNADKTNAARNILLDLGNKEAWKFCFETLCGFIEKLHIGCYRQDFNCDPAACWSANDAPDRKGMTEIGHINGLYALWDALLDRYPDLVIDNCASGGRRIDWETLQRAIPFCRSDFYCGFNANPNVVQSHTSGCSLYFPYTGAWTKLKPESYALRSSYTPAMGSSSWCADFMELSDAELDTLSIYIDEYRSIREFLTEDFYPISTPELDSSAWTIWQYHSPEKDAGFLLLFRREDSPMDRACVKLQGLNADRSYDLEVADEGRTLTLEGKALLENGLSVEIPKQRDSRLIRYTRR